jgi:hypothetical protein
MSDPLAEPSDAIEYHAYMDAMQRLEPDTSDLSDCEAKVYLEKYKSVTAAMNSEPWIKAIESSEVFDDI